MAEMVSEGIREVIEEHLKEFGKRYRAGDMQGVAQLYTEDAVHWITYTGCGREIFQKSYENLFASGVKDMELPVGDVYPWGNRLVQITQCTFLDAAGQALQDVKYIKIYRQEQGKWMPCLLMSA
jgi:ketosteroid isomerase-like protein